MAGLVPAIMWTAWWTLLLAGFWFAFTREDAQHRREEGWLWWVPWRFKDGVGGWRRWLDIIFGAVGGVLAWVVYRFAQ